MYNNPAINAHRFVYVSVITFIAETGPLKICSVTSILSHIVIIVCYTFLFDFFLNIQRKSLKLPFFSN